MSKYLVKRVLLAILSILIVSAITFFVMNLIPGGPFNQEKATSKEAQQVLEERYNLDKPVPEQYVLYMNNLLHGDWGVSLHSGRNIGTEISRKFAVSAKLGGIAAIVAIIIGVILGSIAALTRNKLPDRLIVFFTTLGTAMPSFVPMANTPAVNMKPKKKVYPNDPCPCGSGKKYKKCCGRN